MIHNMFINKRTLFQLGRSFPPCPHFPLGLIAMMQIHIKPNIYLTRVRLFGFILVADVRNGMLVLHGNVVCVTCQNHACYSRVAPTPGARLPRQLNFVCWDLILMGPECVIHFVSSVGHLEI